MIGRLMILELFAAAIGGAAAVVAWNVIPAPYTAFSEISVLELDPQFFFRIDRGGNQDVSPYKKTQMKLVKYPYVLAAALREPRVRNAKMVREQKSPAIWLEEELRVTSSGVEFFKISLSGPNPGELKDIVAAVTSSYFQEVVDKESNVRRECLNQLERAYHAENVDLQAKLRRHRVLSPTTQLTTSQQRDKWQEHLLDLHIPLREELVKVVVERIMAEIELNVRAKHPGFDALRESRNRESESELREKLTLLRVSDAKLQKRLQEKKRSIWVYSG